MSALRAPKPVLLTLKQRRAESICEFFSIRLKRELILRAPTYWVALWLEWSPNLRRYVERPQDPEDCNKQVADFWIDSGTDNELINVGVGGNERPSIVMLTDPWDLKSDGLAKNSDGVVELTESWQWSRRTLLLNIQRVHPFSVAAYTRGGLKATCRRVATCMDRRPQLLGELQERVGGNEYHALCAILHMVHRRQISLNWQEPISLRTQLEAVNHAP